MKVAEAEDEGRRRKKIAAGKQVSSSTHYFNTYCLQYCSLSAGKGETAVRDKGIYLSPPQRAEQIYK